MQYFFTYFVLYLITLLTGIPVFDRQQTLYLLQISEMRSFSTIKWIDIRPNCMYNAHFVLRGKSLDG